MKKLQKHNKNKKIVLRPIITIVLIMFLVGCGARDFHHNLGTDWDSCESDLYYAEEIQYWGEYLGVTPNTDWTSVAIKLAEKVKALEEKCDH